MEVIVLKTAVMFLDELGILHIRYQEQVDMTPEDALKHIDAAVKLCRGKKRPFLVDVSHAQGTYSIEAMKKLAKDPGIVAIRAAQAIIVTSLPNRLLVNFYIRFQKPKNPVKVFGSEKEAVEWLKKFTPEKKHLDLIAQ